MHVCMCVYVCVHVSVCIATYLSVGSYVSECVWYQIKFDIYGTKYPSPQPACMKEN